MPRGYVEHGSQVTTQETDTFASLSLHTRPHKIFLQQKKAETLSNYCSSVVTCQNIIIPLELITDNYSCDKVELVSC